VSTDTLEFLQRPNSGDELPVAAPIEPLGGGDPHPDTEPVKAPEPHHAKEETKEEAPKEQTPAPAPTPKPESAQEEPKSNGAPVESKQEDSQSADMSYADIAAKGPEQTNEEKMPDYVPEIAHDDSGVHSLDSLDSTHLQSASSFADTQREAEEAEEKAANHAREQAEELKKAGDNAATKAEQSARGFANKAEQKADELKKKAGVEGKKAKKEAKEAEDWADKNKGNPVVIGNVVAVAALGGLLGVGAYRKYNAHELTWKVAGAWAGAVGLFAVGDYFVSQWLFKNRYPPKN